MVLLFELTKIARKVRNLMLTTKPKREREREKQNVLYKKCNICPLISWDKFGGVCCCCCCSFTVACNNSDLTTRIKHSVDVSKRYVSYVNHA